MSKPKVLFTEHLHPALEERLSMLGMDCIHKPLIDNAGVLAEIGDYFGLVISTKILVDKKLIDQAGALRFIARAGSGMENIDTKYASERGIVCINSPEGNRDAVAEQAIAMLLSLFNKLPKAQAEVKSGIWLREENRGEELMGKCVGLIGYGNTGRAMARKLSGFDVEILVYDKYVPQTKDSWVRMCSLMELQQNSDILSLHIPHTRETHHWIDLKFMNNMRNPFYLINTSRGKVLKTADLVEALKTGLIRGAMLDVLENEHLSSLNSEEKIWFNALTMMENVIITPHVAGWTFQSKEKIATVLAEKISDWLRIR